MKRILLIDNYDSFTYNLHELLTRQNVAVTVRRNDELDFETCKAYDAFVVSPGPGTPKSAGQLMELIATFYQHKPILGICLGMQAIAEVVGSKLKLMQKPLHGIATPINCQSVAMFQGVSEQPVVGRYHSWIVDEKRLSSNISIIATDEENRIMGLQVDNTQTVGLQFHPESILTPEGDKMIANFLTQIAFKS